MKVELLVKEKADKEEEYVEVIADMRGSAFVGVQEGKIKITEDISNTGFQNVAGWHEDLAKLTCDPFNTVQDPTKQLKVGREEEGAQKVPSGDD